MKKSIKFYILISTASLLLTCSGCKKDDTENDKRSYSFSVSHGSSSVANATVSIQTRAAIYSKSTDNNGRCKIMIPNDIVLPQYTIVTVDHVSIRPHCLTVSGEANAYSSTPINCEDAPSIVRLKEVKLHHLGNDLYDGTANSQLQLPTEGYEKSFSYNLPATPGVMPRVQIYARGIQHTVKIYCNGILTGSLVDSNTNGDLSRYDFKMNGNASNIFHAGNNIITIKTGATGNSNDEWDDIEFCGLMIYYP